MITATALRLCTDQWQCARDYRANEQSWRMTLAEHTAAWAGDTCPQCSGRFLAVRELATALLLPDSLPDPIGGEL